MTPRLALADPENFEMPPRTPRATFPHMPVSAALALVAALIAGGPALARDELPAEVRQALQANADALSPLTVTWSRERISDLPLAAVQSRARCGADPDFLSPETVRHRRQGSMCYSRYKRWWHQLNKQGTAVDLAKPLALHEHEQAFDLQTLYIANLDSNVRLLMLQSADKLIAQGQPAEAPYGECVYLERAGFRVPTTVIEMRSRTLMTQLSALLEEGGRLQSLGEEIVDGSPHTVVEVVADGKRHRFLLDPAKQYALRRRQVWSSAGRLESVVDCSDLTKLPAPDVWLPRRTREERYHPDDPPGKSYLVETLTVSELDHAPIPREQFSLNYNDRPGFHVADGTIAGADDSRHGQVEYDIPASAADLEGVIEAARKGTSFTPGRLSRSVRTLMFVGVNVLIITVVVLVSRRLRGRRPPTPGAEGARP